MTVQPLTPGQRTHVIAAIKRTLRDESPELFPAEQSGFAGGWSDLLTHVDQLIDIVRRTAADRIEPYLAQILDDICTKCPHQFPSGHCPLRERGLCVLYSHAQPVIRAIIGALCEMHDEPYGQSHAGASGG